LEKGERRGAQTPLAAQHRISLATCALAHGAALRQRRAEGVSAGVARAANQSGDAFGKTSLGGGTPAWLRSRAACWASVSLTSSSGCASRDER